MATLVTICFYFRLFSKRLLFLTTVESIEWVGTERNGPLPTNNTLYENSLILKKEKRNDSI
jgi:hypothetical protein